MNSISRLTKEIGFDSIKNDQKQAEEYTIIKYGKNEKLNLQNYKNVKSNEILPCNNDKFKFSQIIKKSEELIESRNSNNNSLEILENYIN